MAIQAGQIVVKGAEPQQPQHRQQSEQPSAVTDRHVPKEGAALYVNGQRRTIGKKSQYLLDMLTLDD